MRIRYQWLLLVLFTMPVIADDAPKPEVAAEKPDHATAPVTKVIEVEVGDLKLSVPQDWRQEQPSNKLRLAQFSVRPSSGDTESTECTVSPPVGGTIEANISRWMNQFVKEKRQVVVTKGKCPQGDYVFVDMTGTCLRPFGPRVAPKYEPLDGFRMQGVILSASKDGKPVGNYYIKLLGPVNTMDANGESLRIAIGADKSKEEPYELAGVNK